MNKSLRILFLVLLVSLAIAFLWGIIPQIKSSVHFVLDPSAGKLLDWNMTFGLIIISAIISFITMLLQKYTTDQETLRQIKKEQKLLQEEMKTIRDNPKKLMELQRKQFEFVPRTLDITIRPLVYTSVPIILFFRWFGDYFASHPYKFFGFLSWIWAYIIFSIILSSIFKKVLNVA